MKIICTKEEFAEMVEVCTHRVDDGECSSCLLYGSCGGDKKMLKNCDVSSRGHADVDAIAERSGVGVLAVDDSARDELVKGCILSQLEKNCRNCALYSTCSANELTDGDGISAFLVTR